MDASRIKLLFFDLDNTLFDHTRAQMTTLKSMLREFPEFSRVEEDAFIACFMRINERLWKEMAAQRITAPELRELRFRETCRELNIEISNVKSLSAQYLDIYANQTFLFPEVHETLNYLQSRYRLGLLTNGFTETQESKLDNNGLKDYFDHKIYSHDVGALKPSPLIFERAMEVAACSPEETAFVGDSPTDDIAGAKAVGWMGILFDPHEHYPKEKADYKISSLSELRQLF